LRALLETHTPLPRFPLAVRIRSRAGVTRSTARCHNVVGLLPGSDPQLRDEYVVVSAHLDHLGIGTPINGDPIYHGAIDNASGVASIIEIARAIHESGEKPRRSVVFLAVTGEEKFLLGSEFFAAHPTVRGPIVANINIDGVWSMFPLRALEVFGVEESTLGDDIRALAADTGVEIHSAYEPERVLFIRSDQYNFIKKGVPSLFPGIGYYPGSPEEKLAHEWTAVRYHSPADDAKQPVDPSAAARFNDLQRKLVMRIANADARPAWKPDSFFKRFAR
jgi:Zn-dependent M28 family amino/carboxypeptidase